MLSENSSVYAQVKPQAINLNFIHCSKCMYHTTHTAVDLSEGLVRCECGFTHTIRLKPPAGQPSDG